MTDIMETVGPDTLVADNKALRAQLIALRAILEKSTDHTECVQIIKDNDSLRAEVAELRELLGEAEWANHICSNRCRRVDNSLCSYGVGHCPACDMGAGKGHDADCRLAKALR